MSWASIRGHEGPKRFFRLVHQRGRLGQAYLFTGPKGVGKRLFARELAKALLCERPRQLEACDQCDSCKLMDARTHPDMIEVSRPDDSLIIPLDLIRGVALARLAMKASRGGWKVAVIDDADDLGPEAANSFLKTLEEPPPRTLLLLVGGPDLESQLPTIVSRCQITRFGPLAPAEVRDVLALNGVDEPARVEQLLKIADGSPGEALALNDDEIWSFRGELATLLASDRVDVAAVAKKWNEFIDNAGKDAASHRQRASMIAKMLATASLDAVKRLAGVSLAATDAETALVDRFAKRWGEERLLELIDRTLEAGRQIDRKAQLVLVVDSLAAALSRGWG
jgi:DNA polymerase-3 subunit delta'